MARRNRKPKPRRERRDWEDPGVVLKGPPITVTCECGRQEQLPYGERWKCEDCGREYDTGRIPREDYEQIKQLSLRFRLLPIGYSLLVALTAIVFTLTGNVPGVFFLLPVALIAWFVFIRPFHRKRYRAALKGLPRWNLRAEQ